MYYLFLYFTLQTLQIIGFAKLFVIITPFSVFLKRLFYAPQDFVINGYLEDLDDFSSDL